MPIPRLLKFIALTLLPLGLIYGMSTHGHAEAMQGMAIELTCLVLGATLFFAAHYYEKKTGA